MILPYYSRMRSGSPFIPLMLLAVLWLIVPPRAASAHEEPPKTEAERAEQMKRRNLFATRRVEKQHLWILQPGERNPAAETALLTNRFNEAGDLIEQIVHDSARAERSISVYDNDGTWLEETTFKQNGDMERAVFVYGDDGLIRIILVFDARGDQMESLRYDRRPASDSILVEKRDMNANPIYSIQYAYELGSALSRQTEAIQRGADGELKIRTRNVFEGGRRIAKEIYSADGTLSSVFSYAYAPNGDVAEIVRRSPPGAALSRQVLEYRPDGLPSTITDYDGTGRITRNLTYSYEYFPSPNRQGTLSQ